MDDRKNLSKMTAEGMKLDPYSIVRDILRNLPAIILISLSVAMLMYIRADHAYQPVYQIEATYVVNTKGMNNDLIDNLSTTLDVANRLSEVLNSTTLQNKVAEEMGMPYFDGTVYASVVENTNLMSIRVTASTPRKAYLILDSVMRNFPSISEFVIGNATMKVMTEPVIPENPINTFSIKRQLVKTMMLTAVILIALFAFLSYMKDTLRRPSDIEEKLDARLIGVICHEKKHRTLRSLFGRIQYSLLISSQTISFRYSEMFQKASWKIIRQMEKRNAKVLMITSCLENEGKSTVASNVALGIAQNNKKTILVDLDLRKPSLFKIFGKGEESFDAFGEAIQGIFLSEKEQLITEVKKTGLYTVFNSNPYYRSTEMMSSEKLKQIMNYLKEHFDYVILDTPPMDYVADAEEVANLADVSLLVVREHKAVARKVNDVLDALNSTHAECIGCIFNDAHSDFMSFNKYGYGYGNRYYEKYYGSKD